MSSFRQSLDDGSTVPPVAARWIIRMILQKPNPHYWEQALTRGAGLRLLTAKELKAICAALETTRVNRHRPPRERLRSYKNVKKKGLAAMIRACLYVDAPACEVEDAAALRELAARTTMTTTTNNAGAEGVAAIAAASATNATAAAAALPNNIPAAVAVAAAPIVFHPTMMQQSSKRNNGKGNSKRNHAKAFLQSQFAQASNSSTSFSRVSHSPPEQAAAAPAVKPEPSNPETTPQASAFRQLQAMHFSDQREILPTYRKLLDKKAVQMRTIMRQPRRHSNSN